MLEHVLKIFERNVEVQVRDKVTIDNTQFGFMGGKGTTYTICKTVAGNIHSKENRTLDGSRKS